MKRRDLIRYLLKQGCVLAREGAEHSVYFNPVNGKSTTVPRHTEISDNLAKKICKDLDIASPS
jgi:mRNA interferase HicA